MKAITVSAVEWAYPDIWTYESAAQNATLATARGGMPSFQLLLRELPEDTSVSIAFEGGLENFACESYEMVPIYVEATIGLKNIAHVEEGKPPQRIKGCPSRFAPFYTYDCIKPLDEKLTPKDGTAGLYFAFPVPRDASVGAVSGAVRVTVGSKTVRVPVLLKIYPVILPEEEHLKIVNELVAHTMYARHGLKQGSLEHKAMFRKYMQLCRRMKQNTTRASLSDPIITETAPGEYSFDFTPMEEDIRAFLAMGYKYFTIFLGHRKSWQESTILVHGIPSMSYEGYQYLSQYLPALNEMTVRNCWQGRIITSIADEPNEVSATEYRALAGLVRKLAPDIRLHDAVSYVPIHGALDIWVPLNAAYEEHRAEFESFRGEGDEIWHYTCCGPRGNGYVNRFIDYPLLSTRYLFWGNYKYNLSGFLHWGGNYYQPGQDPFTCSCPWHTNTDANNRMPAGDTHIVYPGDGEPWASMRLEAHRLSVEDYELLRMLGEKDKEKADAICAECFRSFKDVEYSVAAFEQTRVRLLEALSE